MFYEQLNKACKENGTSITAVLKKIGVGTANGTYWKNGSVPSSDIVVQLAEFLNVSTDYLLVGKQMQADAFTLNENEQEMLAIFNQFTDREQIKIIGKLEEWFAEKQRRAIAAQNQANIQTAYVAASW